jgi:hypothetical protein
MIREYMAAAIHNLEIMIAELHDRTDARATAAH